MNWLLQTFQLVMQLVDASAPRTHQTGSNTTGTAANNLLMAVMFCLFPDFIFMELKVVEPSG